MRARAPRSGFSLIEALVVLAIGGMALAIIFSIGVKAGDTGFSLGRRAMSASDLDISLGDARVLIRSIALRPAETINPQIDRPLVAEPARLVADVVMERATQCAPQGWTGQMILTVRREAGQSLLTCQAGGDAVNLIGSTDPQARLSYSTDGLAWSANYAQPSRTAATGDGQMRSSRLFVRFQAGNIDVVDEASTGRPESWVRFDDPF